MQEVGCWPQRDSLHPSTLPPELDVCPRPPSTRTHSKLESEDSRKKKARRSVRGENKRESSEDYENESCYDSGGEERGEDETDHDELSRTVSDTLAAELLDTPDLSDPYYAPKVEFALKLGYTQQQVGVALQKLGPDPGQNELLAELIKLGSLGGEPLQVSSPPPVDPSDLRHIVVDGSSVAMTHGKKEVFSCRGILLCVEWFLARGHKNITVLVPGWRKEASRPETPIKDQEILSGLERAGILTFTPSRQVGGKRIVSYDDRYVLKVAAQEDGVVVSNDNYRDLIHESAQFRRVIENNILMYSFVNDKFMPPDDPLGRTGPILDNFLRKSCSSKSRDVAVACPYGKKCTYGNKCKFYHPERGNQPHKSVSEILQERVQLSKKLSSRDSSPGESLKSLSVPLSDVVDSWGIQKRALKRTRSSVPAGAASQGNAQLSLVSTPSTPVLSPGGNNSVSKSKSCENMTNLPLSVHNPNPNPDSIWGSAVWPEGSFALSGDSECSGGGSGNLHRRLERQLTLHPTHDPRLYNLRAPTPPQLMGAATASPAIGDKEQFLRSHSPLSRHKSAGLAMPPADPWKENLHASVSRIASAPDYLPRPGSTATSAIHRMSSTSDTQLNLWGGGSEPAPPWQQSTQNTRYKLYYHLASIFPEEQVKAAMMMYPDETHPQKICGAILTMFPNK